MSDFIAKEEERSQWREDEDFSFLKLGPEYTRLSQNSQCRPMWDDEARVLLEKRLNQDSKDDSSSGNMIREVHEHLKKFQRYDGPEKIQIAQKWITKNFQEDKHLRNLGASTERKQFMSEIEDRKERMKERRPGTGYDQEETVWHCGLGHQNQSNHAQCIPCWSQKNLEDLEVATISNLGITDVEEALKFIPTLNAKFPTETDQEQLKRLLDMLQTFQIPLPEEMD